jgi:hypothetical protein
MRYFKIIPPDNIQYQYIIVLKSSENNRVFNFEGGLNTKSCFDK